MADMDRDSGGGFSQAGEGRQDTGVPDVVPLCAAVEDQEPAGARANAGHGYAANRQITKIARVARRYASDALREGGLGSSEYECLHAIRHHGGINQEQLSVKLNVDKAAVSRMVHSLERKGYVSRRLNPDDRRSKRIYTTGKVASVKTHESSAENGFYAWLFEEIDPADRQVFYRVLDTLVQKARAEWFDQDFRHVRAFAARLPSEDRAADPSTKMPAEIASKTAGERRPEA